MVRALQGRFAAALLSLVMGASVAAPPATAIAKADPGAEDSRASATSLAAPSELPALHAAGGKVPDSAKELVGGSQEPLAVESLSPEPVAATPQPTAEAVTPSPATPPEPEPSATPVATATLSVAPSDAEPAPSGREEVTDLRTESSKTYLNDDGTYTTEFSTDPIFYQPEGSQDWVPVDPAFDAVAGADKAAVSDEAPIEVSVAPGDDPRGFVTIEDGDTRISYKPLPVDLPAVSSTEPALDGARADITDALPAGVDVRVFAHARGANVFLVLDKQPLLNAFTFVVEAPGLTLEAQDDGTVRFLDSTGELAAIMAAPYAVDSGLDEHLGGGQVTDEVSYTLGKLGDLQTVTVSVDETWLKEATYPVYVDPSTTIYNEGTTTYGDAHVSQRSPNNNYANYQRPDSPYYYEMWLGEDPSDPTNYNEAFIKFDLSSVAGKTIDSASLEVRPYHQYYNAPTSTTTWVRRVTGADWAENTIKWSNKPAVATQSGVVSEPCVEGQQCAFDVTTHVQNWVYGTWNAYGFRLDENGNGETYWKRLIASEQQTTTRPRLIVTYHTPTATPTSPVGNAWTNSRTLSWSYSDSGGQPQVQYQVMVDDEPDFLSPRIWNPGWLPGSATSDAIPTATVLTTGTTYYWKVRVDNGTSLSPWVVESFRWDQNPATLVSSAVANHAAATDSTYYEPASGSVDIKIKGLDPTSQSGIKLSYIRLDHVSDDAVTSHNWAIGGTHCNHSNTSALVVVVACAETFNGGGEREVTFTVNGAGVDASFDILYGLTDYAGNFTDYVDTGKDLVFDASLGRQQQHSFETWDLGAGDELAANVGNGNVVLSHPVVTLPIRGSSLSLALSYNSHDTATVGIGPGWRLNVQRRLAIHADGSITLIGPDGARYKFTAPVVNGNTTTYTRPTALYATLVKDTTPDPDRLTLTYRDQSKDLFDVSGSEALLVRSEDRFGNGVTLAYVAGTTKIDTITDTAASRTINFAWDGSNRLTSITDWAWIDGSGVVQTSATGSRRSYRFFYDGSGNLAGWSDPLNTAGICPTNASHLTCLTYLNGLLKDVTKTQTVETLSGGALGTTTRQITTEVTYSGSNVASVRDAEQKFLGGPATTFTWESSTRVRVDRPGTPASETTYGLLSASDAYARVQSVWRTLGATDIEQRIAWDSSFPIERASVTDNYGALLSTPARTVSYTYVAGSLGLSSRVTEPLDGTNNRTTDYTYNANNDVTQVIVALNGSPTVRTITRYCHSADCATSGNGLILLKQIDNYVDGAAGGANGSEQDVTTSYQHDTYGQRTRETRSNYKTGGTLLDSRAIGREYDSWGNVTAEIDNYDNGVVAGTGDDITPNATTNARTDLTTTYTSDTAGNRVSAANPRRQIALALGQSLLADDYVTRWTFDALNQQLSERTPTTPTITITQKTATWSLEELGNIREQRDFGDRYTGTEFDRAGRATQTFEDVDGVGGVAATVTSKASHDAAGRRSWSENEAQANDPAGGTDPGRTERSYDALGRQTSSTAAAGSVSPAIPSVTTTTYDALDRRTSVTNGDNGAADQTTSYLYDLGGRATQTNDEFACSSSTYDYRDLEQTRVEGLSPGNPCSGTGVRTIASSYDGLGRRTLRQVTLGQGLNDKLEENAFDAAGNKVSSSSYVASTSTTLTATHKFNGLDQIIEEDRTLAGGTFAKANYDAAGNPTDRCFWTAPPTDPCKPAGSSFSNPQPTKVTTTDYDARNNPVTFKDPAIGETTYDPTANYQVKGHFIPTAAGKEHQTIYVYDGRNRLDTITEYLCADSDRPSCTGPNTISSTTADDYTYDGNDNRIHVAENNGTTSTDRYYCFDGRDQLAGVYSAAGCSAGQLETYAYDPGGNRTSAGAPASPRTFSYDFEGQLDSCANPTCSVAYDGAGRISALTDNGVTWSFLYDAEGRLVSACEASSCSGSGFDRVDMSYDGEGRRTQLKETPASGSVTTTDFKYQEDAVLQEAVSDGTTRTFTVDEYGAIVKVTVAGDPTPGNNGTYLVTWNGHGDALALSRIEATGTTLLANTFTYDSWGRPSIGAHNGISNLGFRFLYVGQRGVQWDNSFGLGLHYMRARHYSPSLGRFLQPDPPRQEATLYAYAGNNPLSRFDPTGTRFGRIVPFPAWCEASTAAGRNLGVLWVTARMACFGGVQEAGMTVFFYECQASILGVCFWWEQIQVVGRDNQVGPGNLVVADDVVAARGPLYRFRTFHWMRDQRLQRYTAWTGVILR